MGIERQRLRLSSIAEQKDTVQKFKRLLLPLFPESPFVIGAAAELLLSVVEVFGTSEAAMTNIVSIFSVMLPPGNELPSYKALKGIVSGVQSLEFQRLPICAACQLFVFEVDDDRKRCPRSLCKEVRDKDSERELLYFPLASQLKRLMSDETLQPYFKRNALHPVSTDDRVRSIKDSSFWKRWILDSGFADHDGAVVLGASGDGAPPWKKRGMFKYSVFFCGSEVLNLSFERMSDYKNRILHYMWPGPQAANFRQVDVANLRLVADINTFWKPQLLLLNCPPVRVLLAVWSADYPGAGEILAMEGHQAKWGCHRCLFTSSRVGRHPPQLWTGHRAYLPASHPLQSWFEAVSELPPIPATRTDVNSVILRKIARQENDLKDNRNPTFGLCGYKYTCALDKLYGNCGTHNSVSIDLMHIIMGLLKRYFIAQWKGERSPKTSKKFEPTTRPLLISDTEWAKIVAEEKKQYDARESQRDKLRREHKKMALTPTQLLKVDARYKAVDWPKRLANNYLPIKDTGSFTAADCLHFIIYAGPWIMEGLIPTEGNKYDLWLWFVRTITMMCQASFTVAEAIEVRRFTIQTVVLSEAVLPSTEHPILWHLLIHVADDIITKGPVVWYWMFRHERYWGFLISNIRRMTSPEIGIAMAMRRRLRPSKMRGLVEAPLLDIIMGRIEGDATRASALLRQRRLIWEGGQAGWTGAHAGRSAVVHQNSTVCAPRGKGVMGTLTRIERKLLLNCGVPIDDLIRTVRFHDTANLLGNIFSVAISTEGRKHPLRTFVELRHASRQWWGQVLRFVTVSDVSFAFMRVFDNHKVQGHRAQDPTLGVHFVLNGLEIGDSALDCSPPNLVPAFIVPITSIWSNCIMAPIPPPEGRRRQRATRSASHIIIPVRREL
jgi:hypothetical protein